MNTLSRNGDPFPAPTLQQYPRETMYLEKLLANEKIHWGYLA